MSRHRDYGTKTTQVDQAGTYWYHSHSRGQYPDGLRQMIVVSKPNDTYAAQADAEMSLSLSDWYHDEMPALLAGFINVENPTGAEPVPDSGLMNDTQNLTIPVEPAKTYLFHMANVAAFSNYNYWIQDHVMTIVEVDGVATEPAQANMIYITPGQRYSFLVTTKNSSGTNFAMTASMDTVRRPFSDLQTLTYMHRICSIPFPQISTRMSPAGLCTIRQRQSLQRQRSRPLTLLMTLVLYRWMVCRCTTRLIRPYYSIWK